MNHKPSLRIVPTHMFSARDLIYLILFILIWLLPIAYVGSTNGGVPVIPPLKALGVPGILADNTSAYANTYWRVACLFTKRVPNWTHNYYQARLKGTDDWITLDVSDYAVFKPFGYRTRLSAMLSQARRASTASRLRESMARFFKKRYESLYPNDPPVESIRFVRVTLPVGGELAEPKGHWKILPLDSIPEQRQLIVSIHHVGEGYCGPGNFRSGSNFTDHDLRNMHGKNSILDLDLTDSKVTNEGLKYLNAFPRLTNVNLRGTSISDDGLKHIAAITNLVYLNVRETRITDKGLDHIKNMGQLLYLYLSRTRVSDRGVAKLQDLKQIRQLLLSATSITDESLKILQSMAELQLVYLDHTAVTNKGLAYLKSLQKLKTLRIVNTQVTQAGIEDLRRALPDLDLTTR